VRYKGVEMSDELERIKKKALLTDKEINEILGEDATCCYHDRAIAQFQLDKVLLDPRVEIRAEKQELPKPSNRIAPNYFEEVLEAKIYKQAQQDMLTPDSEGNVWVKVKAK